MFCFCPSVHVGAEEKGRKRLCKNLYSHNNNNLNGFLLMSRVVWCVLRESITRTVDVEIKVATRVP